MANASPPAASKSPPPAYNARDDDIVPQFSNINIADLDGLESETPSTSQTICHLKLLHAIHDLRQDISARNGLFGIKDCPQHHSQGTDSDAGRALSFLQDQIREKRWAVYVARAVDRFTVWWDVMKITNNATPLTIREMDNKAGKEAVTQPVKSNGQWMMDTMPPLDVLMIWHCFMLNPRAFLEDCLRQGMMSLWNRGMPWAAVNAVIDTQTGAYTAGNTAKFAWETSTRLNWDNLDNSNCKQIQCPKCIPFGRVSEIATIWTTAGDHFYAFAQKLINSKHDRQQTLTDQVKQVAEAGSGFADKHFMARCRSCRAEVNHETLQAGQFFEDAKGLKGIGHHSHHSEYRLLAQRTPGLRPMKGTLLCSSGIPTAVGASTGSDNISPHPKDFPNRIVAAFMNLGSFDQYSFTYFQSLENVRIKLESTLKDLNSLGFATDAPRVRRIRISREKRISIRRMMSRYWFNSSPFAIDLASACIRQGSFIAKMADIDWLHSPALASTTTRLLTKYTRFVQIMATYPREMAVPTLDVDLGWHTHQLTPRSYYDYTTRKTHGTFIDHDDKVAETALSTAFAQTCKRYQKLYQEPYSNCTCWYCEAIRAQHASSTTQRLFHRSQNRDIEAQLHDAPDGTDTSHGSGAQTTTPHISAHNAIKPTRSAADERVYAARLTSMQAGLRQAYDKACKRAKKDGRAPPPPLPESMYPDEKGKGTNHEAGKLTKDRSGADSQHASSSAYAYGYAYPYAMPYPYFADPCMTSGVYVCDPGCASYAAGSAGACAAGTCGGGVAAGACGGAAAGGSCAGAGMGGCAGGSGAGVGAGTCGGGGGGGGGCGGGGGGCGGGGGGGC